VKPWFAGKADIAPPTWDFKNDGFELAGGRMDYIAGRATPVLTYHVRKHWINLFVFPDSLESQIATENRSGFHIVSWSQDGLAFAAVSDADATAVAKFVKLYRKASAEGENH
ncbi:MAG: hypothetical protein P4L46_01100, partial [Fimbriimonas sp.]|nr:hypothetical protein [Fimbriimonas sp.]